MIDKNKPHLIYFQSIGSGEEGFLSIADINSIPFTVRRVFWTYLTPQNIIRGKHAHRATHMVLIACAGTISVRCEMGDVDFQFYLDQPNMGVYIPPLCWHTMEYSEGSVQMVVANTDFDEKDYIRDYQTFKKL